MSIGKEGREQGEERRREGNAQTWKEGDLYKSQTPLTASGRERGKGKAGRESGKGTLLYETCNSTELNLNVYVRPWLGVCIRDQTI